MKTKLVVVRLIGLFICSSLPSQTPNESYGKDVKSIATIVDAYYDVVSGSSKAHWQFERDKYIHSPNAVITRLDENGKAESHALEAEYVPLVLAAKEDFYEKELKRTVSQFGNIAQVWSAFEIRTDPEIATIVRGLNSIQLHYENDRWFIDSWTCEMKHPNNPLVAQF